jgi:hypothetical protein
MPGKKYTHRMLAEMNREYAERKAKEMTAEEHCKMFCAWKGGGPCLAPDCPRRRTDTSSAGAP